MFKTEKVSDNEIVAIKTKNESAPIKGEDWFPTKYPNVFILAKKNSGKTTVISNILDHCTGKNTKFIFIVSTIWKDPTWKKITNKWEKTNEVFTSQDINEGGTNILNQFMEDRKEPEQTLQAQPPPKPIITKARIPMVGAGNIPNIAAVEVAEPKPERKSRIITPEYIIVLDDLGASMRDKSLTQLLKTNRHLKTMVILSSQSLTDLLPTALNQLDYILAFGRIPEDKQEDLYDKLNVSISFDSFKNLYQDATRIPYSFLYINRGGKEDEYRKGFTEKYLLE